MSNYDFSTINDKEFEELVNDVIEKRDGVIVESYKQGRDRGIDGRAVDENGRVTIIQSKHWIKSGIRPLIAEIKKSEVQKVVKLNPDKYIFATSLDLSERNKVEIKLAFEPFIKDIKDILGRDDLNRMLSKNQDIEIKYYNLWINSTTVIQRMLNNAKHVQSKFKLESIISKNRFYVKTSAYTEAEKTLKINNIILITGNAGIGKTTLAEQMCKLYASSGYSFFYILNSVEEIYDIYNPNEKQVFLYDDFLGSNYLKEIENKEDVRLTQVISTIRKDPTKKLILTTRTNILEQSKLLTELFDRINISKHEIQIKVGEITRLEKAKILYNHIWFSDLKYDYIDELTKDFRYLKVIDHTNFNPRLIEFITDSHRLDDISCNDYWNHVLETLRNPKNIWRHVLLNQTNKLCSHFVVGLVLNGGRLSHKQASQYFFRILGSDIHSSLNESFDNTMRLLVGSLVNRNIGLVNDVYYDLFNPSISDFVLDEYSNNSEYLATIFNKLGTLTSLRTLSDYRVQKIISYDSYLRCLSTLSLTHDKFSIYHRELSHQIVRIIDFDKYPEFKNYLKYISKTIYDIEMVNYQHLNVIIKLLDCGFIEPDCPQLKDFAIKLLHRHMDDLHFVELSIILKRIDILDDENYELLKQGIYEFYNENILDIVTDSGIFSDIYSIGDVSEHIFGSIQEIIEQDISRLEIPIYECMSELSFELANLCDLEKLVEYNIEREDFSPSYSYRKSSDNRVTSSDSEIISLFRKNN
ncbi:TPA: restriction endonuclease [Vibrio vulnificus]|nr:hypothetical protein [Vibrio vulnificus]HAU8271083.1 hypothetical protein [Vibrio vulnificus]HDY7626854.1 restriction endonuclease [Vibrio vulnificus]